MQLIQRNKKQSKIEVDDKVIEVMDLMESVKQGKEAIQKIAKSAFKIKDAVRAVADAQDKMIDEGSPPSKKEEPYPDIFTCQQVDIELGKGGIVWVITEAGMIGVNWLGHIDDRTNEVPGNGI